MNKLILSLLAIVPTVALAGPPTLSGTPTTQPTVGVPWTFTPTVSDPDGDKLVFVVLNKPSWLNLSYSTGKLSGTPPAVATYPSVQLFVKDGTSNVAGPKFTITVKPATNTSECTKLSWTAPTENTDGSALTNLAGYEIVYGPAPDSLVGLRSVSGPTSTTLWVDKSSPGPLYAAVRAVNSKGVQSDNSNIIRVL